MNKLGALEEAYEIVEEMNMAAGQGKRILVTPGTIERLLELLEEAMGGDSGRRAGSGHDLGE